MTAITRPIARQFTPVADLTFSKVLISGCSFTFNNSLEHACSWPYYLRDLANAKEIYDCSQVGAGNAHIFNSIINEVETNNNLDPADSMIIVMLSGLTRTDVIASQEITKPWHDMSNYHFDNQFATLSIPNEIDSSDKSILADMCKLYKLNVDPDAQILESCLKILALDAYLKFKKYNYIITSWKNPESELNNCKLKNKIIDLLAPITYLGDHARSIGECVSDGHPTLNGYLDWTRRHLIPYLILTNLATDLNTV